MYELVQKNTVEVWISKYQGSRNWFIPFTLIHMGKVFLNFQFTNSLQEQIEFENQGATAFSISSYWVFTLRFTIKGVTQIVLSTVWVVTVNNTDVCDVILHSNVEQEKFHHFLTTSVATYIAYHAWKLLASCGLSLRFLSRVTIFAKRMCGHPFT